jgi:HPt (histidine-containing phosphotransfer) domain-containing protein
LTLEEFSAFTIQIHAMKSALASIGAFDLSKNAAALETASRGIDRQFIMEKLPAFVRELKTLAEKIKAAVIPSGATPEATPGVAPGEAGDQDIAPLFPVLEELRQALLVYNIGRIHPLIKQLEAEGPPAWDALNRLSEFVLLGDYEDAAELIKGLLSQNKKTG